MPRLPAPLSLLAALFLLTACEDDPCGPGVAMRAGDVSLCVYPADVVIVGGFDCPPGYSVQLDGGGRVCATDWIDPGELPDDACAQVDCAGLRVHLEIDRPDCEWLDPTHCLSPFPSDRFGTGSGIAIPADAFEGAMISSEPWRGADGFSPATPIVALIEGEIDPAQLAGEDALAASVGVESRTVVLDVSSSSPRRVAHAAELDAWPGRDAGSPTTLWIRPLRLEPGHRYVVALRRLRRPDGTLVPVPAPFRALRDRWTSDSEVVEARRDAFDANVFAPLSIAGVPREDLMLAWDFTVASAASLRADLGAVRDAHRAWADARTPTCAIGPVTLDADGLTRAQATLVAPTFLDAEGRIARSADGAPVAGAERPITVELAIPAAASPSRVLILTHVVGGSASQAIARDEWRLFAREQGAALAAIDLAGTTAAETAAGLTEIAADPSAIARHADHTLQAASDVAALAEALAACAADPALFADGHPSLHPGDVHLVALESATMMVPAFAVVGGTAIDGTVLLGPSASLASWARRSVLAGALDDALATSLPDRADRDLLIAASATWIRSIDGGGWRDELAIRRILSISILGSARAPAFLARLTAHDLGVPLLVPSVVELQTTATTAPGARSAWVALDAGLRDPVSGSRLPEDDNRLEMDLPYLTAARDLLDAFLVPGGTVIDACAGPCDPSTR